VIETGDARFVLTDSTLDMAEGASEVVRVTVDSSATAGTFTLTFDGETTVGIPFNAAAPVVKSALTGLSNIGGQRRKSRENLRQQPMDNHVLWQCRRHGSAEPDGERCRD
jgi:hypothetical protein